MTRFASFLVFLAVASASNEALAQWTNWPSGVGGNDHQYQAFAVPQGITWDDAQTAAQSHGGYLVTLTSQAENDFVFSLIDFPEYWITVPNETLSSGPWTGGVQLDGSPEPDGGWTWVTGETFSYANWAVGEPNNINVAGEERISYWAQQPDARDRVWNDLGRDRSDIIVSYVVERNFIPEPGTVLLMIAGMACLMGYRTPKDRVQ